MDDSMDDSEGADVADSSMDDLLATYRDRKRRALQEAQAKGAVGAPAPSPDVRAAPVPLPAPAPPAVAPTPHVQTHEPAPVAHAHVPHVAAPHEPAAASNLPTTTALAAAPMPTQLTALGPTLKLSEALMADRAVTVRGSPGGRLAGFVLLLLGLALLVVERRSAMLVGGPYLVGGLTLTSIALLLAGVGALLALVFAIVPTKRRLALRLAATQAQEWAQAQEQAKRLELGVKGGIVATVLGLVVAALAYALAPAAVAGILAAPGLGLTAIGLVFWIVCGARRSVARRLYVQTLVLSGLERAGIGATDARVAPVLLALDELLGALPADQVQAFLATPQAQAYLDLIDEAGRSHGQ